MPISVLLADDNAPLRDAAADALTLVADIQLVASVPDGATALGLAAVHRPDVAIVDVEMPGGGASLVTALLAQQPALRVMCLTGRDDVPTVLAMLAAGATAYVTKSNLEEDLATCVRRCASGALFVMADCAEAVRSRIAALLAQG